MPATHFKCSDGVEIPFADCLKSCRMNQRCISKRTLRMVAEQRVWKGAESITTTMMLKGTREAYLEITQTGYSLDPLAELFRVLGSKAHAYLEEFTDNELTEERLHDEIGSGQFDFYDPEEQALLDSKTWGSFAVAKALGLKIESVDVPTGEVYKTGTRKGEPKTRKEYNRIQVEPDMHDTEIQLNHYRMMIEEAGFPVKEMFVEAIVRDGNTFTAKNRGIDKNGYLIPVKRLPNKEVLDYLREKRDALLWAIETGQMPEPCTEEERWNGTKCKSYCRVARFCEYGQQFIKEETDEQI